MSTKFLIFGLPRSGTTILQEHVAYHYNTNTHGEFFGPAGKVSTEAAAIEWLATSYPGVINILSSHIETIDISSIVNNPQHKVIVTNRVNLVDCCISLNFAKQIGKGHFARTPTGVMPFTVPIDHVHYWASYVLAPYYQTVAKWDKQGLEYDLVCYEDMMQDKPITVGDKVFKLSDFVGASTVPSNFNYEELCINYNEVSKILGDLTASPRFDLIQRKGLAQNQ